MKDLRSIEIPKIVDSTEFERLCCDLWDNEDSNEPVSLNGRPGQSQDGVDVYGRNNNEDTWFGIQCKVRESTNKLTENEIIEEINKANNFNPALKNYYVCTTLSRDAELQKIERNISDTLKLQSGFNFKILFWDDIEDKLKLDENINIYFKYYHKHFVDNTTFGHSIGKLINLDLGIGDTVDTHYEIAIGKIPHIKNLESKNVNYYRGVFYIINFHERKMETFPPDCYESDIEMAFSNNFDRFRVCKWINSIKDLDKFIYDDTEDVNFLISDEEYEERMKELRE